VTPAISDTDILSTFGKIGRIDLLLLLFSRIHVSPAVYQELARVDAMGFSWASRVRIVVDLLPVEEPNLEDVERLSISFSQLGRGEIETFVLAAAHKLICLTNDRQAQKLAKSLSLQSLDLEDILRAIKTKGFMSKTEVKELLELIETRDHTRIKAKHHILND
jgi:predicted nucleic acid-binding protein